MEIFWIEIVASLANNKNWKRKIGAFANVSLFLILDKILAKVLFRKMDEKGREGETRVRKVCKKRMWPGVKCFYASKKCYRGNGLSQVRSWYITRCHGFVTRFPRTPVKLPHFCSQT